MPFALAAVLVAVLIILILVLVALVILVLIVLILILVVHGFFPPKYLYGLAAILAYPVIQDLSLALKIRLERSPAQMAAVIPPAEACSPPMKMPRNPFS